PGAGSSCHRRAARAAHARRPVLRAALRWPTGHRGDSRGGWLGRQFDRRRRSLAAEPCASRGAWAARLPHRRAVDWLPTAFRPWPAADRRWRAARTIRVDLPRAEQGLGPAGFGRLDADAYRTRAA